MHFVVRFRPKPGCEETFREELQRVVRVTREEPGCLRIEALESLAEPQEFVIHSVWADEAAFAAHVALPHTQRFLNAAESLLIDEVKGLRAREL